METRMEIQFCDLCNESVPEGDLEAGRAYRRKGRVVCAACDQAMGGLGMTPEAAGAPVGADGGRVPGPAPATSAPAAPPPVVVRSGAGGVLVGLIAIAFATVGFVLILDELEGIGRDVDGVRTEQRLELLSVRNEVERHKAGLPSLLSESEDRLRQSESSERRALKASIDALSVQLAGTDERHTRLADAVDEIESGLDGFDGAAREREAALRKALEGLSEELSLYGARMMDFEETLLRISSRGPVAAVPAGPEAGDEPRVKAWAGLLPDLGHANEGIRLVAIYALGETGDSEVVPHLIPMLSDVSLFVRMATAAMLEELQAKAAVPALIDALEDDESAVREAAMVALQAITGQRFGFEPIASPAERAKRVKEWRDWWKRHGDDFLVGS